MFPSMKYYGRRFAPAIGALVYLIGAILQV